MDDPIDLVLAKLSGVLRTGSGWRARCPAHDDHEPSLSIRRGDRQPVVLTCRAGCSQQDVLAALARLGVKRSDLCGNRRGAKTKEPATRKKKRRKVKRVERRPAAASAKHRRVYQTIDEYVNGGGRQLDGDVPTSARGPAWVYRDSTGRRKLMAVVRVRTGGGGKTFKPFHPVPGGWVMGDPDGLLPLYNLPGLAKHLDDTVFVVEGEKDVETLKALGLCATTSAHGSNAAKKSDWSPLAGRDVVLVPDNDDSGERYARSVARVLFDLDQPPMVRLLRLSGLEDKQDVSDYVAKKRALGWSDRKIARHIRAAVATKADDVEPDLTDGIVVVSFADGTPTPVEWMWGDRIPLGKLSLLVGHQDLGKTTLALDLAARVSTGRHWPDEPPSAEHESGEVLYLSAEDDLEDTLLPRFIAAKGDRANAFLIEGVRDAPDEKNKRSGPRPFSLEKDVTALEKLLRERKGRVRLVVIDPLSAYVGSADSNTDAEVRGLLGPLIAMAARHNVAVVGIMHFRKSGADIVGHRVLGSSGFTNAARAVWACIRDRDDVTRRRVFFCRVKANLAGFDVPNLAYRLSPGVPRRDLTKAGVGSQPTVEWLGEAHTTAEEAMAPEAKSARTRDDIKRWILEQLAGGPVPGKELRERAEAAGYARNTFDRARKELREEGKALCFTRDKKTWWKPST